MNQILVIPSIDIKNRKTVRVVQGIPELNCPRYGDDPVEMALLWRSENAKIIHIVDFDSSHEHSHKNYDIIEEICNSVIIPVEMGGGISSYEEAETLFALGVFRIVIGTLAYENPEEFKKIFERYGPQKISAAIDVIDGEVVVSGRKIKTGLSPEQYAKSLAEIGIERFIVTDIKRNGMLMGPNIQLSVDVAKTTGGKVTVSGGVRNYRDLLDIQEAQEHGLDSVIVGRALYENKFPCQKIWRVAESNIL